MSNFQFAIIGVILAVIVLAVLVLSGVIPGLPGGGGGNSAPLIMWGTFSIQEMTNTLASINDDNYGSFSIKYVQKDEETYEEELVDALASGSGPDIWMITQDMVLKHRNKAFLIPYQSFSKRSFTDTFIDEAELFLSKDGFVAVPVFVDPIVLYWNKDIFKKQGLVAPPRSWDEFLEFSQLLTERDTAGNIVQSGSAMGEFNNITNAKDIISLLILQSGNKIVAHNSEQDSLNVVFGDRGNASVEPVSSALTFFTAFSNPSKVSYSWNRALPDSMSFFTAGKLAMYMGFASDLDNIKLANPHLNFDVVGVPQIDGSSTYYTFGKIYGLAISRSSSNINPAFLAAFEFTKEENLSELTSAISLAPASRGILAKGSSEPALSVFYKAAVQATAWLEPDPKIVSDIFKNMIESIVTGRKRISEAVSSAKSLLNAEIEKVR